MQFFATNKLLLLSIICTPNSAPPLLQLYNFNRFYLYSPPLFSNRYISPRVRFYLQTPSPHSNRYITPPVSTSLLHPSSPIGIEFWSTTCDEETDLAIEAQEAAEHGEQPDVVSKHYMLGALQYVLPPMLQRLTIQVQCVLGN